MRSAVCLLALLPLLVAMATGDPLPAQASSELRQLLVNQKNQLKVALPANTVCSGCLMVNPNADSHPVRARSTAAQMESTLRSNAVPQQVIDKMKAIVFAASVQFQVFTFTIDARVGQGHYETYLGGARRVDATFVEYGVIKAWSAASLVQKTTPVQHSSCKRRWGIKRCSSWIEHVPRGNTAQELSLIENAFRHYAAVSVESKALKQF